MQEGWGAGSRGYAAFWVREPSDSWHTQHCWEPNKGMMKGLHTQQEKPDRWGSGSSRTEQCTTTKNPSLKQELRMDAAKEWCSVLFCSPGWISPSPTLSQNTEDVCFKKFTTVHPLCISARANLPKSVRMQNTAKDTLHHADGSWATVPALQWDTKTRNLVPTANHKHQK